MDVDSEGSISAFLVRLRGMTRTVKLCSFLVTPGRKGVLVAEVVVVPLMCKNRVSACRFAMPAPHSNDVHVTIM
jgi:hypothetical protein